MEDRPEIGIIGGSGLYSILSDAETHEIVTDFGQTSELVSIGTLEGKSVAFIPRHGSKHTLPPHKIPYKANIEALRYVGVKRIIATNAVGSLSKDYKIGDFVFFDQFFNMTQGREDTFTHEEKVVHISTADPYCPELRSVAVDAAKELGIRYHAEGTVVVINGPRFSTRAESKFFSRQGFQLIGMTQYPEVALARERELCYLAIGLVSDYDVGIEGVVDRPVSSEDLQKAFAENMSLLKSLVAEIVKRIPSERSCSCGSALKDATMD